MKRQNLATGVFTVMISVTVIGRGDITGFGGAGSGWSLNGYNIVDGFSTGPDASITDDILTISDVTSYWNARSAFYGAKQPVGAFTASFTYENLTGFQQGGGPYNGIYNPADGFVFTLQNAGPTAIAPDVGSSLGFQGIPFATGIAFNLYNGHIVGIGYAPVAVGSGAYSYLPVSPIDLLSLHPINVTVVYDGTTLNVQLVDAVSQAEFTTSFGVDLVSDVGDVSGYVGFTGSTGAGASDQRISNFSFVSGVPSLTVAANPLWTDSRLMLGPSDQVTLFGATGLWNWGTSHDFGPQGDPQPSLTSDEWIPDGFHGELIGFLGEDPYGVSQNDPRLFRIGAGTVTLAGLSGHLWLGFNDDWSGNNVGDNSGSVQVSIFREQLPTPPVVTITDTSLPPGSVGAPYTCQLHATGGTPPYTWSILSDSQQFPPPGSFSIDGRVSSPGFELSGRFLITFQVRDAPGNVTRKTLTLNVSSRVPVIVIPGTLGTALYEDSLFLLWLNAPQACTTPGDNYLLSMKLSDLGVSQAGISTGPIFDGSLAAGLINTYGELLSRLRTAGYKDGETLYTFPYDWRLDNFSNADRLNDLIVQVIQQPTVDIIAHSMGGLITRSYVARYGESRLDKIIYVGTPHQGAPSAFGALAFNDSLVNRFLDFTCVNSQTLAEVSRTCPSAFELLPRYDFVYSLDSQTYLDFTKCYLQSADGGYGFLISSLWAQEATGFHKFIDTSIDAPQYQIVGSGTPTIAQLTLTVDPLTAARKWSAVADDGDGTVPTMSGTAAIGPQISTYYASGIEHRHLPNDPAVDDLILKLLSGSLTGLPSGIQTIPFSMTPFVEWWSGSPVRVTVTDDSGNLDGLSENGSQSLQIPLSSFFSFEENEGGFLTSDKHYKIKVVATSFGTFSLSFDQKDENGASVEGCAFVNIPVGPMSVGSIDLPSNGVPKTLFLDVDGDGQTDITLAANEPTTFESFSAILNIIVRSFGLNPGIATSLTSKLQAAERAQIAGQTEAARDLLRAFSNEVVAQNGKQLSKPQADGLEKLTTDLLSRF